VPFCRATALTTLLFIAAACASAPAPQTSRPTPVSTTPPDRAPAGLPAGKVLFSKGGLDLWAAAPDGSGRIAVTADGGTGGGYLGARWSPDGALIAAERAVPGEGGSSLFLIRTGGAPLRLTKADTFLDGYAWSPDGRYLTYGEVISGGTAAERLKGQIAFVSAGVSTLLAPTTRPL